MDAGELAKLVSRRDALSGKLDGFEVWLLIFGIFVVIGVAGESVYGIRTWWNNRKLHSVQRQVDIERDAAEQTERESVRLQIAAAQRGAAEATAKAEAFRRDIAKANDSAKQADARAAEANLELEKFKAPRTLTDKQVAEIADKLRPFTGQEFDVTPYWDNPESLGIADRIADALILGGWKYVKPEKSSFMLGGKVGVQVWAHPDADPSTKLAVATLVSALNDEGLYAVPKVQNPGGTNVKHNKITLNVGSKH